MSAADEGAFNPELLPLFEAYLEDLHAGRVPDRAGLVAKHPELAPLLDCLNVLDSLAPPAADKSARLAGSSANDLTIACASDLIGTDDSNEFLIIGDSSDGGHSSSKSSDKHRQPSNDFGKYELLGEIGRGGMGVVYKARQIDLERTVALKMILANHLASEDQVRRFYAEARAAGKLRHANIVSIHEVGQIHGQPYFAMDFVEGQSLLEVIRQCLPDVSTAAECVAAVARAVGYLHTQGIIHRDLKPSNILIDDAGRPFVTDFGLAKMLSVDSKLTQTGVIAGTPSYMAPEQAAGQNERVGPLSDVYSLGAILYELLTGQPPFREASALDTLVQVLEGEPIPPRQTRPQVPRELELICLRCLEKTPERRYPSATALAEDLERFLRGDVVEARPSGVWHHVRRWGRREPALASRLAGFAICAGVIQAKYMILGGVTLRFHLTILSPLAVWAVLSLVFQWMLNQPRGAQFARFAWAAADAVLLTSMLVILNMPPGPLLIGYPLLVTASGLWFRVSLVWFMTAVSLLSYIALILILDIAGDFPHHHVLFLSFLAITGFIVAYQVYRVRVLSHYYARRLP